MHRLRASIRRHRHLAVALLMLALFMKAAIPAGYMVSSSGDTFSITVCSGTTGGAELRQIYVPAKAGGLSGHDAHDQGGEHQCPFTSLAMAATGSIDVPLLAIALVFILKLGLLPAPRLPHRRIAYLLPPQRGPPATA